MEKDHTYNLVIIFGVALFMVVGLFLSTKPTLKYKANIQYSNVQYK